MAAAALGALGAGPASAKADRQHTDVYTFAGLPALVDVGDSTLARTERGVTATLATTGLEPGPHTMWWVVWNNPAACGADGCTEADLGNPEVDVDIGYAAGVVVGKSGRARLTARLQEGRPLTGFPTEFGITSGSGLIDAGSAEIHLVVRSHGPRIPGLVGEMTRTFHAGCDYSVFGGLIAEGSYGTAGPNSCTDVQFAVHP
ncbi:MAG: hypothetical protein ACRDPC_14140 [Solirubrobacteraceae bacterium]